MLAACTPEPEPTPTKTALFASDEEAFAAAEETYRAYTDALNEVDTSDPKTFEPMFAFATGNFLAADKETFSQLHAESLMTTGEMKVAQFIPVSSKKPFDNAVAIVCVDVSATDVVDQEGESRVSPTRPDLNPLTVTFVASGGEMLISHASRDETGACSSN